jgi:hypothetical protein
MPHSIELSSASGLVGGKNYIAVVELMEVFDRPAIGAGYLV